MMTEQALAMPAAIDGSRREAAERVGQLFDAHHQRVFRLARRMTRSADDARDAVQETFLRAARSPESIPEGRSSEEAWLVRVLINICRDRWRHTAVRARAAAAHQVPTETPADPESALLARTMVWQALEALPPRRRAILVLYELEGVAIPAIAALIGVRPVTVRWHLSIGRREMAKALGGTRP
jgi:RNA polymerase sigma factor (sigma-70 family)